MFLVFFMLLLASLLIVPSYLNVLYLLQTRPAAFANWVKLGFSQHNICILKHFIIGTI